MLIFPVMYYIQCRVPVSIIKYNMKIITNCSIITYATHFLEIKVYFKLNKIIY